MIYRALADNPLKTRAHLQAAVRDLFAPLKPHFSKGCTRMLPGDSGHHYSVTAAGLEGFSRPLWGLSPLAAGGGEFGDWELYRRGLTNGANPVHPEYWGIGADCDQRYVECAAIGLALAIAPEQVWVPLSPEAKANLARWLAEINSHRLNNNNWMFFRVIVNIGLEKVGVGYDAQATDEMLQKLDTFYLGDGWYSDGATSQCDYYIPWAMHFYGLIYAKLRSKQDPERADRYRQRATLFAKDFLHWFAESGAALPFGRSLTYRFAQSCFWGALAFADVEALPWGVLKGLALRNIRWWARQPIFSETGILSIGYRYPNLIMAEEYNAPGSPYWAMKTFLPLALPESHPFWQSEEQPLPERENVSVQKHAGMVLCHDQNHDHVFALVSGQYAGFQPRSMVEKYAKFAYSTLFGFNVNCGARSDAPDNMLMFSDDGTDFRVRHKTDEVRITGETIYSRWHPWPDVEVETWLVPTIPWHVRIHRVRTSRALQSIEGGFALNCNGDDSDPQPMLTKSGSSLAHYAFGTSGIRDLTTERQGGCTRTLANLNLMYPRVIVPYLQTDLTPGEHLLTCAVLGLPPCNEVPEIWQQPPVCTQQDKRFMIEYAGKLAATVDL